MCLCLSLSFSYPPPPPKLVLYSIIYVSNWIHIRIPWIAWMFAVDWLFFSTSFECAGEKKTAEDSAMAMLFDSTEEQEPRKSMMLMKERKENTPIPSNLYRFRTLRVLTQNWEQFYFVQWHNNGSNRCQYEINGTVFFVVVVLEQKKGECSHPDPIWETLLNQF